MSPGYQLLPWLKLHHLLALLVIISNSLAISSSAEADTHFHGSAQQKRTPPRVSFRRKLILVLINGFAHYWSHDEHRFNLSGFAQLKRHGTRAAYLQPEFPTLSIPNQYSLLTGLHVEKHGITGDIMYDKHTRTYFRNATQSHDFDVRWWNRTEPVWLTAGKQGVSTILYWWRGCQVPFPRSSKAKVNIECVPFNDSLTTDSLPSQIPNIVQKLKDDRSGFVLINYEMVDVAAHRNGPYSADVAHYIKRISGLLEDLQDSLTKAELWRDTDLIIVSDHGQLAVRLESNVQFVDDFLDDPKIIEASANDGAFMMLYAVPGKEYQVYQELHNKIPNVTVYTIGDLSKKPSWHLATASHLSPIVLVADPGFGIYRRSRFQSFSELPLSLHGYDNDMPAMRAIFYARGVDFKEQHLNEWLRMVDVYQLICHLLAIKCHQHDGSWDRVSNMLLKETDELFALRRSSSPAVFIQYRLMPKLIILLCCIVAANVAMRLVMPC